MTSSLTFEREAVIAIGRRVRRACFERRSSLAVSAACLVANGVRETLGALLASPVALRLLEPVIPNPQAWATITSDALLFGVRGPLCDAAFVLRRQDALALACAAFGEDPGPVRMLSPVENEVIARALRSIAGSLVPVCGRELSPVERILDIRDHLTYFELLVEQPVPLRLGVALSRDPLVRTGAGLRIEDLLDVEVEVTVEFASGTMAAGEFLDLRQGTNVPMNTKTGGPGLLKLAGFVLARGECGALGERHAMIVGAVR